MRYKVFVGVGIIAVLAFFLGCNKPANQTDGKKSSGIPEMTKKTSLDTADIFKEFYSDDTAGQGISKKSSGTSASKSQTFSPSSAPSFSSDEFLENGRYVLQVSCVHAKSLAEKIAATLREKHFPAYIAEVQNPTPELAGTYYRIRIGGFGGYSVAKSFGENTLVPAGYEYWIDKKSNDNTGMEGYGLGGAAVTAPSTNNDGSSSSIWSNREPTSYPAAESNASSFFSPSDVNASPSAATPSSSPSTQAGPDAPLENAAAPPSPQPAPAVPPSATTPASSSPENAPPAISNESSPAPAPESNEWGTDSPTSSDSDGW